MDPHSQAIIHGSGQSCWRTPPAMAAKLVQTFGCVVDLAATSESRVCDLYYGPDSSNPARRDSLQVNWAATAISRGMALIGFLNPSYSLREIRERKAQGLATDHLRIEKWAEKAYRESLQGFTTIGVFPYSPQTEWFRECVMGHQTLDDGTVTWRGHAALDFWRIPHRVSYLQPDGSPSANAGVNTCIIIWGPNPGFVGPWVPSGRYWSYR